MSPQGGPAPKVWARASHTWVSSVKVTWLEGQAGVGLGRVVLRKECTHGNQTDLASNSGPDESLSLLSLRLPLCKMGLMPSLLRCEY